MVAPAAANAAPAATANPTCVIPAGASYQLVRAVQRNRITAIYDQTWKASSGGLHYNGRVLSYGLYSRNPIQAQATQASGAFGVIGVNCTISGTPAFT